MALRNYITHPADGSLEVAHVVGGAIQVGATAPLPVTVSNPSTTPAGEPFSVRNAGFVEVDNTTLPILSVQHAGVGTLKMLLRQLEVYNDGQDVAFIDLVVGGTLTGASFAAVDPGSEFEVDTAATAITGGVVIASLIVGRDTTRELTGDLNSALLIDGTAPGPVSVVVSDEAGGKKVAVCAILSWLES